MDSDKKKRPSKKPTPLKLPDLQSMRKELDELKTSVRKHKEILQVQDNWHSRIAKMIGKDVRVCLGQHSNNAARTVKGELQYADRYTVGLKVPVGKDCSEERIYNKGKIEYIASL